MIHEIPPGRTVTLSISRNGQPLTIKAALVSRKKAYSYSYGPEGKDFHSEMPAIPPIPSIPDMDIPTSIVVVHSSIRSGLMIENLTPQLGDFFGAKNGQGVLVRSVEKGSRAEKAGFHAGDVIVRINGETINDTGDFSHALSAHKDKDNTASISIIRDKKEQTITLTLPERSHSQVIDESLGMPNVDADVDADIDLSELKSELAQLKPAIDQAAEEAARVQTAEVRRIAPEIKRQMKEYRGQKEELRRQMRDMQQQLHDHQHELQRELNHELQTHCTWI
jgi:membrane-associated protease RseP (regulator of RpoE activity)